jgi:hypothetical protein
MRRCGSSFHVIDSINLDADLSWRSAQEQSVSDDNGLPTSVCNASLANEYGTGTGYGSDDVLRCVVDVYAQASIHIFLQVVYI